MINWPVPTVSVGQTVLNITLVLLTITVTTLSLITRCYQLFLATLRIPLCSQNSGNPVITGCHLVVRPRLSPGLQRRATIELFKEAGPLQTNIFLIVLGDIVMGR